MLTGYGGPHSVPLAVRVPGAYLLRVRFSDGVTRSFAVDLAKQKRVVVNAERADAEQKGGR